MSILSTGEMYDLVWRHDAFPGADRVAVACAEVESGCNTEAVGDNGHSIGLWQMHDQGMGAGMTVEQRQDPDQAAAVMVPAFNANYQAAIDAGLVGVEAARYCAMYTERPAGFPDLHCEAADRYAAAWAALPVTTAPAPPPPPPVLTYAPDTSANYQSLNWTCALNSSYWMLRAVGIVVPDKQIYGQWMVEAGLINSSLGLLDGSGTALADWMSATFGVNCVALGALSWSTLQEHGGFGPIGMGGHAWYHWAAAREYDASSNTCWLMNPAGEYMGVGDTLTQPDFNRLGPFYGIRIPVEAEMTQPPHAGASNEDLINALGYIQGDCCDALQYEVDKLNVATSLEEVQTIALHGIQPVINTIRNVGK